MKVICISGKAQHGKTTTAVMMKSKLEKSGNKVLITSYAGLVKYICKAFFDWDGKKDEKGRALLQFVGTDVVRAQDPNYWVNFIADMLTFFEDEWDYVILDDCRFLNEIEELASRGFKVTHVRVVRDNFDSPLTEKAQRHMSETALDNILPDVKIMNVGTLSELRETIEEVLGWITKDITYDEYIELRDASEKFLDIVLSTLSVDKAMKFFELATKDFNQHEW